MLTHKQLRAKALRRSDVKAEFEKVGEEFSLLDEFLKARAERGLTQAQVAERIGTTQSIRRSTICGGAAEIVVAAGVTACVSLDASSVAAPPTDGSGVKPLGVVVSA